MPRNKPIKKEDTRGGAREGSGPKTYLPNPKRIMLTIPGDFEEELKAKFKKLIDKYRVKK